MEQINAGSIRLKNPKTIQKWIDLGWFMETIKEGYIFAIGCGRFTPTPCTCHYCRKRKKSTIRHLLEVNNISKDHFN